MVKSHEEEFEDIVAERTADLKSANDPKDHLHSSKQIARGKFKILSPGKVFTKTTVVNMVW